MTIRPNQDDPRSGRRPGRAVWLRAALCAPILGAFLGAGCQQHDHTDPEGGAEPDPAAAAESSEPPHIDLPPSVIHNLGITFATAQRDVLGDWLTVPGELIVPTHRQYPLVTPAHAHVVDLVEPWTQVKKGDVLARLHSPALSSAKSALLGAESELERHRQEVRAQTEQLAEAEQLLIETERFLAVANSRVDELQQVIDGGGALARRELLDASKAASDAGLVRLEARIGRDDLISRLAQTKQAVSQAELEIERALHELGILTGFEPMQLREEVEGQPRWVSLDEISLRAPADGVVSELNTSIGLPIDHGDPVVTVIDPRLLHFHGALPQNQIGRIPAGAAAKVELGDLSIEARLIGPVPMADAVSRSLEIIAEVDNAEMLLVPGLAATLLVNADPSGEARIVIPEDAVLQDGLSFLVFHRADDHDHDHDEGEESHHHDDEYIPAEVRLGRRSGGMVEILEGLELGEIVVHRGVRQVWSAFEEQQSSSGGRGGHMHADGTWHEDH